MGRVNRSVKRRSVRYLVSALRRFACEPASTNRYDPLADVRQGKVLLRRVALRLSHARRRVFAEAITRELARRYWAEIQTSFDSPWPLPEPEKAVARIIGRAAARLDTTHAGYVIGTTYAALLPEDVRSSLGAYYTPPALAARLLDQATAAGVEWTRCSVLDPACGGGAFLAPVAERMLKTLTDLDPLASVREVERRIRGFDVDPFAAWLSQVFLEAVLLPQCRLAGVRLRTLVEVKDALAIGDGTRTYDFVVGNPPYGRVSLPAPMRQRFERSLYGHANLYGLFTDLAVRLTRRGGIIAYVTPTSFLAGEYFSKLRSLLGQEAPPTTVDFITRRKAVFDDVLQEALLLTCMRGGTTREAPVAFIIPIDDSSIQITAIGTFTLPESIGDPWIVPRLPEHQALTVRLRMMPHRLADWGYAISTGPLVWNRHKSQLASKPGSNVRPLVWAEAVTSDGRFTFRAAKKNHTLYFRCGPADNWLIVREPCVLLQRTTAREQARRLVAAVMPQAFLDAQSGAVVENHLNMVYPIISKPPVTLEVVAAFLNSTVADESFRCISGSVAVSASELEALPVPDPRSLDRVIAMIAAGADRVAVDSEFECLYRLTQ